jgi:hypothetical protein
MKLNKLFDKAKRTIDDRGGIESLKEPGVPGSEKAGRPGGDQSRQQS